MQRLGVLLLTVFTGLIWAQGPPPGGGPGGPGGGSGRGGRGAPTATNLKVLTQQNFLGVMFGMQAALGQRCDFCHVQDRASDELAMKVTARRMMVMVKTINDTAFNGEQKVSCFTCHHGEQKPAAPPPGRGPGGPGGASGGTGRPGGGPPPGQ